MADDLSSQIASKIQDLFRSSPAVLFGSGFSCGYNLPHMGALGDYLASNLEHKLASLEAKALWANAITEVRANLEKGLNTIPSGAIGRDEIVATLRELTAELIINRNASAERNILDCAEPSTLAPARLLKRLFDQSPQNAPGVSVITTNYDTLIELFCDLAHLPVETGFQGFRRRRFREGTIFETYYSRSVATTKNGSHFEHRPNAAVRILKPHGSITWVTTASGPVEVLNEHSTATRAIVVPGPSKYEDALVNSLFDRIRAEMNATLARTNSLLSVGFGFNDEHLQGIIRSRLKDGMPAVILTKDLTPSARDVITEHPHIVAVCQDNTGSLCQVDGKQWRSSKPLWQLDSFLSYFIE